MSKQSRVGAWILGLVCAGPLAWAQGLLIDRPQQYMLEAGAYGASSDRMPFWMRTNQFGIVPLQAPVATFRGSLSADYDTTRLRQRRLAIGYGLFAVSNTTRQGTNVLLPEAYVKARWGAFEFYAGRRRELFGLVDTTLSTGSYAWSGNALPVPKVQLGIPTFTAVPFTKNWVSVMGLYAHGWLNGTGYVQHSMLHQKMLYVRLGRPTSKFKLYGGFNHQAVWGGRSEALVGTGLVVSPNLPSSLRDYWYVVTARRGARPDPTQYTNFDITNRVGNHLGTLDVALDIRMARSSLFLYRQSIYEDGSLFYLTNLVDGLHGLRIRRHKPDAFVRDIVFEFLNTTSQGGPDFIIDVNKKRGRDDYFNNGQFRDGWSYQGQTLGTPFIPPAWGPNGEWPFGLFTLNNRVQVWHVGLLGSLPIQPGRLLPGRIRYQAKLSYSRNLGTYREPFVPVRNQLSGWFDLAIPLPAQFELGGSVAIDRGALYTNSTGVFVALRKRWLRSER